MTELTDQLNKAESQRHWPAFLSLGFDKGEAKTRMHRMQFLGPLRVQRPFYPEGEVCHVYLLHPPGGLVSGDDLNIQLTCEPGSKVLVTTPSAGKIYRADSNGIAQKQRVDIEVTDSQCEWLPMETIVFDGAHGRLSTHINLYGQAQFFGLDVFCLGRPKSNLPFASGSVEQRLALYHDDVPLLLERQFLAADDPLISAISGFNGNLVSGTLVAFGLADPEQAVEQLHSLLQQQAMTTLSVTCRLNVLVVRYLGACSEQAQTQLRACWQQLRPLMNGTPACVPRIWNT
ncbi:urease accessory protein UreD [Reinekea marinisedimentorum]|uniref:Urease accessory protein UreD n=1 Tax=Reinekea marinisedimentorum TaxID=230495 RepID=A0A4R3I2K6_9GAMM|nr:urease accessory protein UreD [Reinekea marinisedimentorum]TCS39001.1 urease accessory protein [Reinekea marinisedimentorum]